MDPISQWTNTCLKMFAALFREIIGASCCRPPCFDSRGPLVGAGVGHLPCEGPFVRSVLQPYLKFENVFE
ncbi:hypothetical protein L596_022287 [Steinernema carpocapsae]|uniref:Uncharacterized protein n=1 Tax=Steinernema carpocapsae TaxID=34508 RepID=A0A4U5ML84_STECR|nr:hypothetical protein L596_022287 [Steinernema carpocapsae]